jgi:hypothetical protein
MANKPIRKAFIEMLKCRRSDENVMDESVMNENTENALVEK